jgi:outer membrane biosynthesis protein TonB
MQIAERFRGIPNDIRSVKIEITIAKDGSVKSTRVLGGHPLLAQNAERAALSSTFEPGPKETIETLEFKFSANN